MACHDCSALHLEWCCVQLDILQLREVYGMMTMNLPRSLVLLVLYTYVLMTVECVEARYIN